MRIILLSAAQFCLHFYSLEDKKITSIKTQMTNEIQFTAREAKLQHSPTAAKTTCKPQPGKLSIHQGYYTYTLRYKTCVFIIPLQGL